jgi:hypothetical protein
MAEPRCAPFAGTLAASRDGQGVRVDREPCDREITSRQTGDEGVGCCRARSSTRSSCCHGVFSGAVNSRRAAGSCTFTLDARRAPRRWLRLRANRNPTTRMHARCSPRNTPRQPGSPWPPLQPALPRHSPPRRRPSGYSTAGQQAVARRRDRDHWTPPSRELKTQSQVNRSR